MYKRQLLLILMVMSGFSSCGILFSGGTQVSGQTIYTAEDRDIRGAETDYKKLEKELEDVYKRQSLFCGIPQATLALHLA